MGIADSMQQTMQANMQKQIAAQKELMTEMNLKTRQAQLSVQFGMGKERMHYLSALIAVLAVFGPIAAHKTKNPAMVAPLFPLGLLWVYQYDMYYGNMQIRVQQEAARLIREEPERFFLPSSSGIIDQKGYNKIVGIPENYNPKLK